MPSSRRPGVTVPDGADVMAAWDVFLEKVGVPQDQRNSASALIDPAGVGPKIFFQQVPPAKSGKNRLHLDVRAAPGLEGQERMAALEAEAERLVALGADRLERFDPNPAKMWAGWIVMADPEGNEFCLD